MSASLICLAIKKTKISQNTFWVKIGRVYSPYIYIFHMFVGQYFLLSNFDECPFVKASIIFAGSLLLSICYIYLKKSVKTIYK